MHLLEKLEFDSTRTKGKVRKLVSKRILELITDWEKGNTGQDYFIFRHTFNENVNIYKLVEKLTSEQIDKLDEIVEMLNHPRQ